MNKIELKDTVNMMISGDYKQELIAEYLQSKIRLEKLKLEFKNLKLHEKHTIYDIAFYQERIGVLSRHIELLAIEAENKNIDLTNPPLPYHNAKK